MNAAEIVASRRSTLSRLRPVKVAARERATELMSKRHGLIEQGKERAEIRDLVDNHDFDLFPTPPDLARRMVELAEAGRRCWEMIEPSAGTGNIAKAARDAGFSVQCIEFGYSAAQYLTRQGFNTWQGDFLEWKAESNTFIMNPPFSHAADIDHVTHAWNLLLPGGRIVAIMSAGTQHRSDNKTRHFRESILPHASLIETLPAGTFKQSGTNVTSILIVLNKEL